MSTPKRSRRARVPPMGQYSWAMRRLHWAVSGAWDRVATPKLYTVAMCVTYLMFLIGWVPALVMPPNSLEGAVGLASMYMIGTLIVVGAAVGIPAALAGQFRVERWSLIAVGVGVVFYVLIVHTLHWSSTGNRLPQAQTIAALLPMFVPRLVRVWRRPVGTKEETLVTGKDHSTAAE